MDGENTQQNQYLSFFVAGEEYALGILDVREIVEFTTLTKIPSAPPAIRGVVNLRGRVVPVVDLALRFGLSETGVTKRTCIVMIETEWEGEHTVVGILADAVSQVMELPADSVQAPPSFGTRARAEYLRGMANAGDKFVLILNIQQVLETLADDAARAVEEAAADGDGAPAGVVPPQAAEAAPAAG